MNLTLCSEGRLSLPHESEEELSVALSDLLFQVAMELAECESTGEDDESENHC